ncbi:hypothetical protein [Oceanobacillus iheyensis HTE831]|uniref:Uncharacterized protein n=1 Tax=Oceanobacillus iheyensis (strain DSM 14371 / CIP 107618 / JCM 11309 / KCTC 3954 / HTE831) TaxID=221109 RepID=Q8EL66_OCEIH|nr:hypothetical protein [Oceanobacillus iheyensis]BAC15321.1 hypothetical protein [Oceanobacillus iheyensis HTE831]
MFVKFEEIDLLELFNSEGESLTGNKDDGELLYTSSIIEFSLSIYIRTYEQQVSLFLKYKGKDIFYADLKNVYEIKKVDNILKILSDEKQIASITFGEEFIIDLKEE